MPRKSRHSEPGVVYHLISRFVDRGWFVREEEERARYLALLERALVASDWRCLAYAVMSSHLHLAAVAGEQSLESWVRRVHAPFADWMNRRHGRIGPMFVRGPKAFATADGRVGDLIAYIHNNPVRAGVVASPRDSTWTSHRAYASLDRAPRWLLVSEGLERAGFAEASAFDRWVSTAAADPTRTTHLRELAGREADQRDWRTIQRRRVSRVDAGVVVERTAREVGISIGSLCSQRRGPAHALARRVAATCAASLGISGVEISRALRISEQRVSAIRIRDGQAADVVAVSARVLDRVAGSQAP